MLKDNNQKRVFIFLSLFAISTACQNDEEFKSSGESYSKPQSEDTIATPAKVPQGTLGNSNQVEINQPVVESTDPVRFWGSMP